MQTLVKVFAICLPLLLMCGCAFLSSLFGVNEDGTVKPGGGPLGTIATLINFWIPGTAAAVGAITTTIAAIKAKNWKKAFTSSAEVIESGAKLGKSVKDIKGELKVAHSAAGVGGLVKSVISKIDPKAEPVK